MQRSEGLPVKKNHRKMGLLGKSNAERHQATRPGEIEISDLVTDMTPSGFPFRLLSLMGKNTRQSLAIYPAWFIRANDFIEVLINAMQNYGQPQLLRSDNGPEFIASAMKDCLADLNVKTKYISSRLPCQESKTRNLMINSRINV